MILLLVAVVLGVVTLFNVLNMFGSSASSPRRLPSRTSGRPCAG
jgi:hypothetical protein